MKRLLNIIWDYFHPYPVCDSPRPGHFHPDMDCALLCDLETNHKTRHYAKIYTKTHGFEGEAWWPNYAASSQSGVAG